MTCNLPEQRHDAHQGPRVEVQLPVERGQQDPVAVHERQQVPEPPQREPDARAGNHEPADERCAVGLPAAHARADPHPDPDRQAGVQQPVHVGRTAASSSTTRTCRRSGSCAQSRYTGSADVNSYASARQGCLWNVQPLTNNTSGLRTADLPELVPDRSEDLGGQDRRHVLPDEQARRRPQPEVRRGLAPGADHELLPLQRRRALPRCSAWATTPASAATAQWWRPVRRPVWWRAVRRSTATS